MGLTNIEAIKKFFEKDGGRKVEMSELRNLSTDERYELAKDARKALGEPEDENSPLPPVA